MHPACPKNRLTERAYTVQLAGSSDKLDAFIEAIGSVAIMEVARTGVCGIARGERILAL